MIRYIFFITLVLISVNCAHKNIPLAHNNVILLKNFGSFGDGIHDDTEAIQRAINAAYSVQGTVVFEEDKKYLITKLLSFRCSVNGAGSTIIPKVNGLDIIKCSQANIKIEDLNIEFGNFRNIRIDSDNVQFKNCIIKGNSNFSLFLINGHNFNVKNSIVQNLYKESRNIAFYSRKPINEFLADSCQITGGIYFANKEKTIVGNHKILNSKFDIDFSHTTQSIKVSDDAVSLYGISNVEFINDTFNLLNVNRGFKFSDKLDESNFEVSEFTTNNILFSNCIINAESNNGKQLMDFYRGTGSVKIDSSTIYCKGHTTVFENKTQQQSNIPFKLSLHNSNIYFDFKLIYVRTNDNPANVLDLRDNKLIYTSNTYNYSISRKGQEKLITASYLGGAYNIENIAIVNNSFVSTYNITSKYPTWFISNVNNANIIGNTIEGYIKLANIQGQNKIKIHENIVTNNSIESFIQTDKTVKIDNIIERNNQMKNK